MRKWMLIINVVALLLTAAFFTYTFVARDHLAGLAREFVTKKTLEYSKNVFAFSEKVMKEPLAKTLLSKDQFELIQNEINLYNEDTEAYISRLTNKRKDSFSVASKNPFAKKALSFKTKCREYYDDTLKKLIIDVRIFAGSNLAAALIAVLLTYYSNEEKQKKILFSSFIILISIGYCSYLYIDGMNFFTILFRLHLGWAYPVLLVICYIELYRRYKDFVPVTKESDK